MTTDQKSLADVKQDEQQEKFLKVQNILLTSTWGMTAAQIAQSSRLSLKTVNHILKQYSSSFKVTDGV